MDKPRPEGRGGGVTAIYRKDIKTSTISIPAAHSFEHLTFKLSGPTPLVTAIIYRLPKPNCSFLSDFSDFLTQLYAISPSVLLQFWEISISTLTQTAIMPPNSWNYYTALISPYMSTFPPIAVVTSWILSAPLVSPYITSPASSSTSQTTWQSSWTLTSPFQPLRTNGQYLSETSNPSPLQSFQHLLPVKYLPPPTANLQPL